MLIVNMQLWYRELIFFTLAFSALRSSEGQYPSINENWSEQPPSDQFSVSGNSGDASYPVEDPDADDGYSLSMTLNANPPVGPGTGPEAESNSYILYGTYWTRMKTADCSSQSEVGVVTGLFPFFNNGSDLNGNGIPDNSELDFEWLCAQPEVVYLTIWTDNNDDTGECRRAYRSVNIQTGEVLEQYYATCPGDSCQQQLSPNEMQPGSINPVPDYDPTNTYYRYGLILSSDRVQFLMTQDGQNVVTLWDYQGPPERIPSNPMQLMYNVWHTDDWVPSDDPGATHPPQQPVTISIDWSTYDPSS